MNELDDYSLYDYKNSHAIPDRISKYKVEMLINCIIKYLLNAIDAASKLCCLSKATIITFK